MPIPLPNLDDLSFDELVAEGKRMIPGLAPGWTDHNPSDPGIAFIELFAFVAEMLMYRANTVSDADKRVFVKLLRGGQPDWPQADYTEKPLDDEIRDAVLRMRVEERAVTPDDFLRHATNFGDANFPRGGVARAHCLPRFPWLNDSSQANVTVLVVPDAHVENARVQGLLEKVRGDLTRRCPLTTRLHVSEPHYVPITVHLDVYVFPDQIEATIRKEIEAELSTFFNALVGGADGAGWPFGRAVYVSDLYALLDGIPGVDYITGLASGDPIETNDDSSNRRIKAVIDGAEIFIGMALKPNDLVKFDAADTSNNINIRRQVMPLPEE
jgi:hypothetical protein